MEFKKTIEIDSDKEDVWELIKDYKRIPEFWHGTRSIEKDGSYYMVQFAFPGKGKMQLKEDKDNFILTENYIKGPFTGEKTTEVSGTNSVKVVSEWNIKLSPMLRAFSKNYRGILNREQKMH
jgi:Uncharacterized conserved protein